MEELFTFGAINSRLQGHPDMTALPGVDMSTGSLGARAFARNWHGNRREAAGQRVSHLRHVGDGETQEGQIWEAAFVAARYQLDNLIAILGCYGLQQWGWRDAGKFVKPIDQPVEEWKAFGWNVIEADGHDFGQFCAAAEEAGQHKEGPSIVIAHTSKGKGVSFMEDQFQWHAKVRSTFDTTLGYIFASTQNFADIRGGGRFWDGEKYWPCQKPPWGLLAAVDTRSGDFAWQVPLSSYPEMEALGFKNAGTPNRGGTTATAGGIVFVSGTLDKKFRAFESKTGKELWSTDIGAAGHAIPITYQGRDRKQYVAVMVSGGGFMNDPVITRDADGLYACRAHLIRRYES